MSGPLYLGFLVEEWSPETIDDLKRALPEAIRAGLSSSEPECLELFVHAHEGSAWLRIEDSCGGLDVATANAEPAAAAIAKAAGSATWLYEYNDSGSFFVGATRFGEDGTPGKPVTVSEETDVPADIADEPDFTFARFAQDRVSLAILRKVRWDQEQLRTGEDDYEGPALLSQVTGDAHPLLEYFPSDEGQPEDGAQGADEAEGDEGEAVAAKKPAPAPKTPAMVKAEQALDRLEGDALRVTRTLDGLISLLEEDQPDLDRYLARARDDRLEAAFDPALETLRTLAESVGRAPLSDIALPLPPKVQKALEHQKTPKGAPKDKDQLLARLKAARDGVARDNVSTLERAMRSGLPGQKEALLVAGQLKLIRLVLHLAHLALLEGEDILRELSDEG